MSRHPDYLTATDIYRFLQCPHWPYYERFATDEEKRLKTPVTESQRLRQENGYAHEREVVTKLFKEQPILEVPDVKDADRNFEATLEQMRNGAPLIYQGTLTNGDWTGLPDLLERHEGESKFGPWFYVPVDVKSSHALEKYQKLQLIFYATLLERIQGRFPAEPAIINSDSERISFQADAHIAEFEQVVTELERIRAGEKPDPVLRKSCYDTGPWGVMCERYAKSLNDIALLYNVDIHKLRSLRQLGVRSIDDAAEIDPSSLDGLAKGLRVHSLEVIKRQAQSLKTSAVIIRKPVLLPNSGLEIHFDIESDPPNDVDYLYGILMRLPEGDSYQAFVAEHLEDEEKMWRAFLAWIETLPAEYHVYHYAAYEPMRLGVLKKRYGGSQALDVFATRLIDLKETVTHAVVYPLYFYGLKYILPFLGFSWSGDIKSGGQSIDVFERYLETKDRAVLDSIIQYNEDDVRATAYLKDWMVTYAREMTSYAEPYPWKNTYVGHRQIGR